MTSPGNKSLNPGTTRSYIRKRQQSPELPWPILHAPVSVLPESEVTGNR